MRHWPVLVLAPLLLVACCNSSAAQDKRLNSQNANGGIVYGHGYSFVIIGPKGWVLDNGSGVSQGLQAVFYPRGSSWQGGATVMYAQAVPKKNAQETVQQVIKADLGELKAESPKMVVQDAASLPTSSGRKVIVKSLSGTPFGNREAIAYINESKVVVELVLSARTKAQFVTSLPAFRQLVSSYSFVTSDVRIKRH